MKLLRITPKEYYELRENTKYPSLSENLADNFGVDKRISIKPFVKTYLPSNKILQYENIIISVITRGADLVKLATQIEKGGSESTQNRFVKGWEKMSGLKQTF